jgi:hypothetical protein
MSENKLYVIKDFETGSYIAAGDQWTTDISKAKRMPAPRADYLATYMRKHEGHKRAYAIEMSTAVDISEDGG